MKALIFSDLHCGVYKEHASLGNLFETSCRILREVLKADVDCILFAGDLYDVGKKPPTKVVNAITDILSELDKPFIAISGNHDISEDYIGDTPGTTLLKHLSTVFPNFMLIDNDFFTIEKYTIFGIPYHPDSKDVLRSLSKFPVMNFRKNILLTHQNYPGYIAGQDYSVTDVNQFDFVFNGHIHTYHQFAPGGYNLGNPYHRDLGDIEDDKYYLILDGDKITRHKFDFPRVERPKVVVKSQTAIPQSKVEFKSPRVILEEYCKEQSLLEIGLTYL